jgi:predicted aspartyl protease
MDRLLVVLTLLFAGAAHAACDVQPLATVPVTVADNQAVVPVALNGQDAPMLLDTGAGRTLLTAAVVQRDALPQDEWVSTPLVGAGNRIENRRNVVLRSMTVGGVPLLRRGISQTISLAVTSIQLDAAGRVAGLLGGDLLSRFDVELDFPAGRMTLYSVAGCSGRFLPWHGPYDAIAATRLPEGTLLLPVFVDGRQLDAELDTGSSASLIDARGLHRLGVTEAALAHDPSTRAIGIGGAFVDQRHRFSELRVGSIKIAAPEVRVARLPRAGVDMLLGMDVLKSRRIWISYATAQLFMATP